MSETGAQTWHELAEANSEYEQVIDQTLQDYWSGHPIHTIMERLKKAREGIAYGG